MRFAIKNVPANAIASQATFGSLEEARAALREALCWPEVQLGPGYTAPDTKGQVLRRMWKWPPVEMNEAAPICW